MVGEIATSVNIQTTKVNLWNALFTKKTRASVRMPFSVASIRGSVILAKASAVENTVSVLGGEVSFQSLSGERETLTDNQSSKITSPKGPPAIPAPITVGDQQQFSAQKAWVKKTTDTIVAKAPPQARAAARDEKERIADLVKMLPDDAVPPTITITSPVLQAKSGATSLEVTGVATDDVKLVSVVVNGQTASVEESGNWTATVELTKGKNKIKAVATDGSGNSATAEASVELDPNQPIIDVDAFKTTKDTQITLQGAVIAPDGVESFTINGMPMTVGPSGLFAAEVELGSGENLLVLNVTDRKGREATEEVKIRKAGKSPTIKLNALPRKVSDPLFVVTGQASAQGTDLASVTVNGSAVLVAEDGSFTTAVMLHPGQNTILAEVLDVAGNSATTEKRVDLDIASASIRLTSPKDGLITGGDVVTVNGSVRSALGTASLTVNGTEAAVARNGSFSVQVELVPGENLIDVVAEDLAGKITSTSLTVHQLNEGPSLSVSQPEDGLRSSGSDIVVSGSAQAGVGPIKPVTVNGRMVLIGHDGSFTGSVTLKRGANTVAIAATDSAGNTTVERRTVWYEAREVAGLTITSPKEGQVVGKPALTVSGTVDRDLSADQVWINGLPVAVDRQGRFSSEVTLTTGRNTVSVSLPEALGSQTELRMVYLANTVPEVIIESPVNGTRTSVSDVVIRGRVTNKSGAPVVVTVNKLVTSIGPDGSFAQAISLRPGSSLVVVCAVDDAKNAGTSWVGIIYEPMVPRGKESTTEQSTPAKLRDIGPATESKGGGGSTDSGGKAGESENSGGGGKTDSGGNANAGGNAGGGGKTDSGGNTDKGGNSGGGKRLP